MMSPVSVHAYQGLERAIAEAARAAATSVFAYSGKDAAGRPAPGLRNDQRVTTAADLARANAAGKASGRRFRRGDKMAGTLLDITV
jgi:hypothetical protein